MSLLNQNVYIGNLIYRCRHRMEQIKDESLISCGTVWEDVKYGNTLWRYQVDGLQERGGFTLILPFCFHVAWSNIV